MTLDPCCAPCVTTPPVNIPGAAGVDCFTTTTSNTTIPAVGAAVSIDVDNSIAFSAGETILVWHSQFPVGPFATFSLFGVNTGVLQAVFLGSAGDSAPGTVIAFPALVVPVGSPGKNAFTNTTGNTAITLVGGSFTLPVNDSSWAAIGQTIFASDGTNMGTFTVTAIASGQITGTFLGLTGDSVPNFTIGAGAIVTPAANPNTTYPVAIGNGGTNATTAAQARTNLGAAGSGANTDITSLANLSTAITIAQGGTGQTTAVAGLTALITAAKAGTFVCNGVTQVTVTNTNVTSASVIIVTLKTVGGTVGAVPAVKTITPGAGFTVAGTASDTSIYNYVILN